jgi:pimeloyl-ACP methyl ester carboxylesterase
VNGSGISARNAGQRPGMRDAIEAGMHAYTRPFRAPDGEPLPGTIAESATMRLGGLDQWVMIRGENVSNPPLILLHGGPGMPESPFFRCFNAPLESAFTVVYWDQRGAGKSFDRCIPRSTMTVEQFVADLDELVDEVRTRLGKTKVVMLGHSWGSALGPLYAARFPEKVALYVGAAQIGDWAAGEKLSYAFALAEAERQGNRKMLEKLYAIGPPPHSTNSLFIERTCVAPRRKDARRATVEGRTDRARQRRIVVPRLRPHDARLSVLARRDVARGVATEPPPAGSRPADARGLPARAQGPLGPARDECRLLRRADRAIEEAGVVRGVVARDVRGRIGQVQRRDDGAGAVGRYLKVQHGDRLHNSRFAWNAVRITYN